MDLFAVDCCEANADEQMIVIYLVRGISHRLLNRKKKRKGNGEEEKGTDEKETTRQTVWLRMHLFKADFNSLTTVPHCSPRGKRVGKEMPEPIHSPDFGWRATSLRPATCPGICGRLRTLPLSEASRRNKSTSKGSSTSKIIPWR